MCFTAHQETLSNGLEVKLGAGVGLLTRNIKSVGESYDDIYKESFGARVLVGLVSVDGQTYTGMNLIVSHFDMFIKIFRLLKHFLVKILIHVF